MFADSSELTRVTQEECYHCECHQRRIEDVYSPLYTQKIAIAAHSILNNTENIPDHDESGRQVKHGQCRLPRNSLLLVTSGVAPEPDIEQQGSDDEEAENDDLKDQPADNYVPTKLRVYGAVSHASLDPQSGATRLDDEAENIAEHEDSCEPSRRYYGAVSGVEGADQSAERHVQGCREEDGSKEKQGRLQDIWYEFARRIVCQRPADIAYSLDCKSNQPWL